MIIQLVDEGGKMDIVCNHCNGKFKVADEKIPVGKTVSIPCPKCKNKLSVSANQKPKIDPPKEAPAVDDIRADTYDASEKPFDFVEEEGKTVIAVVHNLNLAAAYCDNLIFMKDGGIHCAGPKEAVLTAENIMDVFGVESRVQLDDFSGSSQVSFKY